MGTYIRIQTTRTRSTYTDPLPKKPTIQRNTLPPRTHRSHMHRPEGNVSSIDGPLRRVMTRSIDRPLEHATRRVDATRRRTTWRCETRRTTPPRGANPRDRRRNCASYRAGASRTIETIARRARASSSRVPCVTRMERATDGLFAPRRARAHRMDRMRRMSASGDGPMSARKHAPSSARRLSRPSAYGT